MPSPINKYRTYCKTCTDFTLHTFKAKEDLICDSCGTKATNYKLNEVAPDLIEAQRKRYKVAKINRMGGIYGAFMRGVGIEAIMSLEDIPQRVIECDAGQDDIDRIAKQKREQEKQERLDLYSEYQAKYKHLNRNDKCSCGSGKKYKHCHLQQFKSF